MSVFEAPLDPVDDGKHEIACSVFSTLRCILTLCENPVVGLSRCCKCASSRPHQLVVQHARRGSPWLEKICMRSPGLSLVRELPATHFEAQACSALSHSRDMILLFASSFFWGNLSMNFFAGSCSGTSSPLSLSSPEIIISAPTAPAAPTR